MSDNLYFDPSDRELLAMINATYEGASESTLAQKLFNTTLHPHGIIHLATSNEYRIAYAVINLLKSLGNQKLDAQARLLALKSLYDEVINSAQTPFRINTGRVLIQLMKEIVRARGNETKQLMLIHDFVKVSAGNPRIVRAFMAPRHLLEMPEAWDQLTLDNHVHDANTKGRKNPTYLIMDAWIKGIRNLTVIYYHSIDPDDARELLAAARIMGINIRIGIEFRGVFNKKYVHLTWAPRGFSDDEKLVQFLESADVQKIMTQGKKANEWISEQATKTLEAFNKEKLATLAKEFDLDALPALKVKDFENFVGKSTVSRLHVAEFIYTSYAATLNEKAKKLQDALARAKDKKLTEMTQALEAIKAFTPQKIYNDCVLAKNYTGIADIDVPKNDKRPTLLTIKFNDLLKTLTPLRSGYRTTLQLRNLTAGDVLELLWDAQGLITHIERFNLKDFVEGHVKELDKIGALQSAINSGRVLAVKTIVRELLAQAKAEKITARAKKFQTILENIPTLLALYANSPLGSSFGTDSTSNLGNRAGMGLAVKETLPAGAQKKLKGQKGIPVSVSVNIGDNYMDTVEPSCLTKLIRRLTGKTTFGMSKKRALEIDQTSVKVSDNGNIIALGGKNEANESLAPEKTSAQETEKPGKTYLRTPVLNILKVLFGLVPAFCTFMVTQNWWFLAFFGAFLWLGITGVRNIIQMIISAGTAFGTRVKWYQAVQWTRLCESLMYTGWSVVLLEGLTRNLILVGLLDIKVTEYPLLVFTVIALTNGTYISSHNIYRGFPMTAVVGNFFRSVLAIPVALVYNVILAAVLPFLTTMPVGEVLIYSSAIITKLASDTIALLIEATADRRNFYRICHIDYMQKLNEVYAIFDALEAKLGDIDPLTLMADSKSFAKKLEEVTPGAQKKIIVHMLDMMYFWYYQKAAHQEFKHIVNKMNTLERSVIIKLVYFVKDIGEDIEGELTDVLGKKVDMTMRFYRDNIDDYVRTMTCVFGKN